MLFEQGQTVGISDRSFVMWAKDHPLGYHLKEDKMKYENEYKEKMLKLALWYWRVWSTWAAHIWGSNET